MFRSSSSSKSGSGWLDRIRTAKGFPESVATDLENFIQNNNPIDDPIDPVPIGSDTNRKSSNNNNISMSDVLHELFNFGDHCPNSLLKKASRKQSNPKICPTFPNNNNNNTTTTNTNNPPLVLLNHNHVDDDGSDWNLPGFSRTEVTVIDTSYESWKFDKLLFRKNNVWKVRDKKKNGNAGGLNNKRKPKQLKNSQH